jgi:hypothetical protein
MAADQLQGGVEDTAAHRRRRLEAEFLEQVLLAAEQPVQGGAGDACSGGQLIHGEPGQSVLVWVRPMPFASGRGCGEGRQDLLLGDGRGWHEIILDEMYRLV